MPAIVVCIQARVGSTRLPGKVLQDLAGRPMLRFQLDRLAGRHEGELVVATSDLPGDDEVVRIAAAAGVAVVRGPERDVLERFGQVLDRFDPEHLVRLTGDCPLTDPGIVTEVLDRHLTSGADYTSNVHPRSFPKGLDVEVATASALRAARAEAGEPDEREHVMPFLYGHPDRFTIANVASGDPALGDLRWTVDEAADLDHVRRLVALVDDPTAATWQEVLDAARSEGLA